ncbi:MAG TPA: glycosyltransferase family 39 protein [Polyangiaceae bacterium]
MAALHPRSALRWAPLAVAATVPALLFLVLPPLSRSGLWDPYELNVAELARRIACNTFGAASLVLPGADNSMPHLNDLGRPELPFTSVALGFRIFGLHEWAGRLPLALWGILGALATYAFVARLFDRRTGAYAAAILATTPLYFVQARTMLGDVCTMAGLAMAFGGLAAAAFDGDERGPTRLTKRLPWIAMGAAGLVVGFESRGGLLGLAVPLLGVGLTWGVVRASARGGATDRIGDVVGAASLLAGLGAAARVGFALAHPGAANVLDFWVGAPVHAPSPHATFDVTIGSIGHALAPWSAFLPFAFGRLLIAPRGRTGPVSERESVARVALVVGTTTALVAHAVLATRADAVAFSAPALCAVACAVALRDFERGAHASIAVGLGTLVLAAILHHDFHDQPTKAFAAFGVSGATFPASFEPESLLLWWVALGGFAACTFLTWVERDARRVPFDPATYANVVRTLRGARGGPLPFVYASSVAGAAVAALAVMIGTRAHAHWTAGMSSTVRDLVLSAWWVVGVVPFAAILGLLFACDVWLWAFGDAGRPSARTARRWMEPLAVIRGHLVTSCGEERWVAWCVLLPALVVSAPLLFAMGVVGDLLRHRAPALALAGGLVGFVLCFFYYPALANQLSPREVFDGYHRACGGAPLGLLGVGGRTAAYYAGGQPVTTTDAAGAYRWLTAGAADRRCLAMKSDELPALNALWRQHAAEPKDNLPVVDARSSQILLAASSLRAGEVNANPLSSIVLPTAPHPRRRLDVDLDDQLEVLGTDILDERRRPVDAVQPGRSYRLVAYYRVLAHVTTEWQPFVHVDGQNRRHNGDHKMTDGKYPMSLWLPGDFIADESELKLEPNFSPGTYTLWFGLAVGDRCTDRLRVKTGPSDGCNRIDGGPLRVQ